jgi:hypothetical protein
LIEYTQGLPTVGLWLGPWSVARTGPVVAVGEVARAGSAVGEAMLELAVLELADEALVELDADFDFDFELPHAPSDIASTNAAAIAGNTRVIPTGGSPVGWIGRLIPL